MYTRTELPHLLTIQLSGRRPNRGFVVIPGEALINRLGNHPISFSEFAESGCLGSGLLVTASDLGYTVVREMSCQMVSDEVNGLGAIAIPGEGGVRLYGMPINKISLFHGQRVRGLIVRPKSMTIHSLMKPGDRQDEQYDRFFCGVCFSI